MGFRAQVTNYSFKLLSVLWLDHHRCKFRPRSKYNLIVVAGCPLSLYHLPSFSTTSISLSIADYWLLHAHREPCPLLL
ncbi:hypothetical protein Sjap_002324 [Stephania japonica]|uniref:Uncharacterized protein n=1 Tax=Stephania japonica TaxID=461633 RepID=A0AAP0KP05_9MAGN